MKGGVYVIPLCSFVWYTHPDFSSIQQATPLIIVLGFFFILFDVVYRLSRHHRCGLWYLGPRRLTIGEELQSENKKRAENKSGSVQSTAHGWLLFGWRFHPLSVSYSERGGRRTTSHTVCIKQEVVRIDDEEEKFRQKGERIETKQINIMIMIVFRLCGNQPQVNNSM